MSLSMLLLFQGFERNKARQSPLHQQNDLYYQTSSLAFIPRQSKAELNYHNDTGHGSHHSPEQMLLTRIYTERTRRIIFTC